MLQFLQQRRVIRITSRFCSNNFGLPRFSCGANIGVAPPMFPLLGSKLEPD
jgi:hypothetical protein